MYNANKQIKWKINSLVIGCRIMFFFFSLIASLGFFLVIIQRQYINLIPLGTVVAFLFTLCYYIYSMLAFKMPVGITIESGEIKVISIRKSYCFNINELAEIGDGVNNIILKFIKRGKIFRFYLPKYIGSKNNLESNNLFNHYKNIKRAKIKYDFFLRFF